MGSIGHRDRLVLKLALQDIVGLKGFQCFYFKNLLFIDTFRNIPTQSTFVKSNNTFLLPEVDGLGGRMDVDKRLYYLQNHVCHC